MAEQIEKQKVKVAEAKGRPMLHWVGKKPLDYVTVFPAQLVETFNPTGEENEAQGLLFHGDNKDAMAWLLANGYRRKVTLVYIDPPYDSGANYVRRVQLRGVDVSQLEAEGYTLNEQIQYTDIWANDNLLQFMYERLLLLKELLSPRGVIYVHSDWRQFHNMRCLLDEVFGPSNYLNTISWRSQVPRGAKAQAFYYPLSTHYLHMYARDKDHPATWNRPVREVTVPESEAANELMKDAHGYFRTSDPGSYSLQSLIRLYHEGRIYVSHGGTAIVDEEKGTITTTKGQLYVKYYRRQLPNGDVVVEKPIDNLWEDIPGLGTVPGEERNYPTQKTEPLLTRVVEVSSNRGDLVLDCFVGSGTTVGVAQKLGRRWIGCDINKGSIQTTSKYLQAIIQDQIQGAQTHKEADEDAVNRLAPAALSFSIYRANDYDLQIQHNEAVNLVVEHIGIQPTRTDPFFDGTLGKRLVKIVPFNHPLTLLDLQLLQDEVKARPDEDRDIVMVCLGKETAVDPWLEDYNKHRPVNKIEVIELRTDQKYGKFFVHQPAHAEVRIERRDNKIIVQIEDFISPTIIERLEMDTPLFKVEIPDWRAMVDVVLIDTSYGGEVFDITLSDVPEKKDDLVQGYYELEVLEGETTVAVKIIDMLGEEVITTARV